MMSNIADIFTEVAEHWDLDTLYDDVASGKGRRLTPVEKLHLRGLLCGYSPAEIAEKLYKTVKGVESELCTTIYVYVKNLLGKQSEKVENWRNITEWLEQAGYKNNISPQCKFNNNCIPVELIGKVAHIFISKDKIKIEIDLTNRETPNNNSIKSNQNHKNS